MGYNAPAGADLESRAPWLSDPGEPEEKEYDVEDRLESEDDEDYPNG